MKTKIQKKDILPYLSYIMLYVSLFCGDIYNIDGLNTVTRALRLGAYALITVSCIDLRMKKIELLRMIMVIVLTLLYGIKTGDLYWSILVIFIYNTKRINIRTIYEISYGIVLVGIVIVLTCCVLGILPDVLTSRSTIENIEYNRHSFGFYHSNVLPLLIFYLEVYYICIAKEKIRKATIVHYMSAAIIASVFCKSRNALISSAILSVFVIFKHRKCQSKHTPLYMMAVAEVPCLSLFSFVMMFLPTKGSTWDVVDMAFSGRFRLADYKMRRVGIHLINVMSNKDFLNDNIAYVDGKTMNTIVLDNGYLYVMLRYGLLILLFYFIVSYLLAAKNKENTSIMGAIIAVFMINFVDNDLVDYSFLPFILWAFNDWKSNYVIRNMEDRINEIYKGK